MGMTVKRRKDQAVPRVFEHKVADISGGVSVKPRNSAAISFLKARPSALPTTAFATS